MLLARAKGLSTSRILVRHALRPSSFSLLTVSALTVGNLLGGAVIVEQLFALPGIGRLLFDAIFQRDLMIVQGMVLVITVGFVLINVVVDVLYVVLDPRLRARSAGPWLSRPPSATPTVLRPPRGHARRGRPGRRPHHSARRGRRPAGARRRGGGAPAPPPVRGVTFWLAAAWLILVVVVAITASWLPLADPEEQDLANRLAPPFSGGHLLGTDGLGRDILSRLAYGARVSLIISLAAVSIGTLVGGSLGLFVGYVRGRVEGVVMWAINVMLAFPGLVLLLGLVAFVGQSLHRDHAGGRVPVDPDVRPGRPRHHADRGPARVRPRRPGPRRQPRGG